MSDDEMRPIINDRAWTDDDKREVIRALHVSPRRGPLLRDARAVTTKLARRAGAAEIAATTIDAVDKIRRGCALIAEAEDALSQLLTLDSIHTIRARHHDRLDVRDPEPALKAMQHQVWSCLIERLGVRRMLSVARARELDRDLELLRMPDVTERDQRPLRVVRGSPS